ncbi:single-stranded DNA-binding protein [Neoactinobaculum massilliense]|uniref:single-stranded DNA-binding protein n=1 Tax=Neoactinobaculum massilliense TaxID=2364794 RepID=UPI000F53A1BE|nr:single-stranded DNA-binding protein [Neoactinobaculum massilliense]
MAGEPILTVVGNLTADPELRFTNAGVPVASFTVASTPRKKNQQTGDWEDGEPMFLRCSVWRDYAENVAESLTKGTRVMVTGRFTVRSYQTNNGETRQSLDLQVDEIGPSLRYAKAQVTKTSGGGHGGQGGRGNYGGNYGGGSGNFGGNGGYANGGNAGGSYNSGASYTAPQGGSANDPWQTVPQGGSAIDDYPPF